MLANECRVRIVDIVNERFHGYRYYLELGQINQADKINRMENVAKEP